MPLYLPRNLAVLTKLAGDAARYALAGVHVLNPGDTTFRLEVTDGRRLLVVRGNSATDLDFATLDAAAHGGAGGIIPAEVWTHCFTKLPGKKDSHVGLALAQDGFTFGTPNNSQQGDFLEGRYPAVDEVLPKALPLIELVVDPKHLVGLLDVAAVLGCERVRLLWFGKNQLLGVSGRSESGLFLDGVLVPIPDTNPRT